MLTGVWFRPLLTVFQMRNIGYARISSPDQNLDRQIAALRGEGCDEIYREKASGKDAHGETPLPRQSRDGQAAISAQDCCRARRGRATLLPRYLASVR